MEATADTQNISILYCNRAMCQLKMKEFAAAKQSCNKALELDITSEKSWFRLMQACKNMDESTETLQAGLEVLKLNPKNVTAKKVVDELTKQNIRGLMRWICSLHTGFAEVIKVFYFIAHD